MWAMTIREYIKRRFRDLLLNMVVAYAVLQALSLCIQRWPKAFVAAPWIFAAAAPILLMVMAWNGVKLMRISCPRCLVPWEALRWQAPSARRSNTVRTAT